MLSNGMVAGAVLAVMLVCITVTECVEQREKSRRDCYRAAGDNGQLVLACQ